MAGRTCRDSDEDHTPYTKRAMAKAMIEAMEQLGHVHFALAGHDRGGRVSYRLALDHPGRLSKLAVLDILPTYDYWERIEPALRAEDLSLGVSGAALSVAGNADRRRIRISSSSRRWRARPRSKTLDAIDPRALEHYLAPFRDPSRVHAMCEDYRAGAYADYEIDKADFDAGKKITIPMLALWGDAGIASAAATPLDTWKNWATNVQGAPVDSGHFLTGGKSGCDGEVAAGVFSGGVSYRRSSSYPRKRVSSTPRPIDQLLTSLEYWIIRFRG